MKTDLGDQLERLEKRIERRDELLRAVLYYADNPMTGTSLQLICDDIRRVFLEDSK